jgi:hypothetical protein
MKERGGPIARERAAFDSPPAPVGDGDVAKIWNTGKSFKTLMRFFCARNPVMVNSVLSDYCACGAVPRSACPSHSPSGVFSLHPFRYRGPVSLRNWILTKSKYWPGKPDKP